MSDERGDLTPDRDHYECIDLDLGRELWRLDDPDTDPELRETLRRHAHYCHACRILLALDAEIESAVRDGALPVPSLPAARPAWPRLVLGSGAFALAASLALIALLPTQGTLGKLTTREQGAPAIVRPVADEVIASGRPTISWSPVPGARAYEVSVRSVDGDYAWSGRSETTSIRIPRDDALPRDRRFRVAVVPVPPRTGPEGGMDSSFRRSSWLTAGSYRVTHARGSVQSLGIVGLLAIIAGMGGALRRRPVSS